MTKKLDVLGEQIAFGHEAELALQATSRLDAEREAQIINELVAFFRAEPWDERKAIRYIAALSELRARREELIYRARKAAHAREQLATTPDGAAAEE